MATKKPISNYSGKQKEIGGGDYVEPASLGSGSGGATKFLREDNSWQSVGSFTLIQTEVDLGSVPVRSGSFTITTTGLTSGKPVMLQQAVGPYTGKGTLADEAEMDGLTISASTTSTTTIVAYWNSATYVKGNFKFNYIISA